MSCAAVAEDSFLNAVSLSRLFCISERTIMAEPCLVSSPSCFPLCCARKRANVHTFTVKLPPTAAHTVRSAARVSLSSQKMSVRAPLSQLAFTSSLSFLSAVFKTGAMNEFIIAVIIPYCTQFLKILWRKSFYFLLFVCYNSEYEKIG